MINQLLATTLYSSGSTSSTSILAMFGAMLTILLLPMIIISIIMIVGMWKIFTKAGRPGWEAIIPFYNMYVLTEISGQNGLLFLLVFIPGVGTLIWHIMVALKLAPAFGKDTGFTIGLILLPPIFYCILGFGSAQYSLKSSGTASTTQPTPDASPATDATATPEANTTPTASPDTNTDQTPSAPAV